MRKLFFVLVIGIFQLSCATGLKKYSVEMPPIVEKRLSNGLTILYLADNKLPVVSVSMMIKSGAAADPIGKSGLSMITSELLEKGTKSKNADQLADAFALLGTGLSTSVDFDYVFISTSGLSSTQVEVFNLFTEVLKEPTFNASEFQKTKSQLLAAIQQMYDEPSSLADQMFARALMANYPYGRSKMGTIKDVKSIQSKDVIKHYYQYYRPNNAMLVVTGDISNEGKAALETALGSWKTREVPSLTFASFPELSAREFTVIHKADLKQSEIRMGHRGIQRNHPDFVALRVANTVLGGNFSSRLMSEIRVRRGLTYGIRSNFDSSLMPGPFEVETATRHDKVGEIVNETLNVITEFRNRGITQAELDEAKAFLVGKFVQGLETPEAVARNLLALRLNGISDSFLKEYISILNGLTVSDVNAAISRHLHPDKLKVVVYSPKNQVLDQLRPLGTVEVKAVTDF